MAIGGGSGNWCLEYLRFTRAEFKEIAIVLGFPLLHPIYALRCSCVGTLSTVAPLRLRDLGWMSTIFSDVCVLILHNLNCGLAQAAVLRNDVVGTGSTYRSGTQMLPAAIRLLSAPSHPEL